MLKTSDVLVAFAEAFGITIVSVLGALAIIGGLLAVVIWILTGVYSG